MCEITRNTATLYRQHYEYFSFQVIGKNRLGTHKNVIRFNHFANGEWSHDDNEIHFYFSCGKTIGF